MLEQPIDRSLQKIKIFFRLFGLNTEGREMTWLERGTYLFHFCMLITAIIVNAAIIFKQPSPVGSHIPAVIIEVSGALVSMLALYKTCNHIFYKKTTYELINNIRKLERNRLFNNSYAQKMVKDEKKLLMLALVLMGTINVGMIVVYHVGPFVLWVVNYYSKLSENEIYHDFKITRVFHPLFLWWIMTIITIGHISIDYLFYTCCTHIKIQFMMLRDEMEQLIPGSVTEEETSGLQETFSDLVKWHQVIISCAENLKLVFSGPNLSQYILSSLNICFFGFTMMFHTKASRIGMGLSLLFSMKQIFYICLFGDMLTDSCTNVSKGVYNCKWYLRVIKVPIRKMMVIIMTRAHKPCKITAGSFADVNLKNFVKILSSSWSYFALLQTLYAKSK